jgi:hypothetical protein
MITYYKQIFSYFFTDNLFLFYAFFRSLDSLVRIVTGYGLDHKSSNIGKVRFFSSPQRPDRFCVPPSLLSNGYRGFFTGVKQPVVMLPIPLHLMPRSRIMKLYLHSLLCFHGIALNKLSTGTTLYSIFDIIKYESLSESKLLTKQVRKNYYMQKVCIYVSYFSKQSPQELGHLSRGLSFCTPVWMKSAACELSHVLTPSINSSLLLKRCDLNQFFR